MRHILILTLLLTLTACTAAQSGKATGALGYSMTCDGAGRVLAQTEPGKTTDYDYDTYGRMTTMTVTDTPVAAALATYDSAALLSCTAICVGQGGL